MFSKCKEKALQSEYHLMEARRHSGPLRLASIRMNTRVLKHSSGYGVRNARQLPNLEVLREAIDQHVRWPFAGL